MMGDRLMGTGYWQVRNGALTSSIKQWRSIVRSPENKKPSL